MNALIQFPSKRAKTSLLTRPDARPGGSAGLAHRPISECLQIWADDLRARGLVTEASYLDAALLTIQRYERAEAARAKKSGGAKTP